MGRFLLCVCGAGSLAAVTPSTAAARPVTLPASQLNIELSYNWSAYDVSDDFGDLVKYTGDGGGGVTIYQFNSCSELVKAFADLHTSGTSSYGSDFLPYGWSGTQSSDGKDHVYCYEKGNSRAVGVRDTNDATGVWKDLLVGMLNTVQSSSFSTGVAYDHNVVTLYGTGVTTRIPDYKLRYGDADTSASKDVLTVKTSTGSAAITLYKRYDSCDTAVSAVAPSSASLTTDHYQTGWSKYLLSGTQLDAWCYQSGSTIVVLGPTYEALTAIGAGGYEVTSLLSAIYEENNAPTLGEVQTLPNSQWKVAMLPSYVVGVYDAAAFEEDYWMGEYADYGAPSEDAKAHAVANREDMLSLSGNSFGILVSRPTDACDAVMLGTSTYDPTWVPDGWRSGTSYDGRVFCRTVEGSTMEVVVHSYTSITRLSLVALLDSLVYQNTPQPTYDTTSYTPDGTTTPTDTGYTPTPYSYKPPRKSVLPFPLELSFQTLSTSLQDRGYGARLGIHLSRPLAGPRLSIGVDGEVAYDTESKLAYDLGGELYLRLTDSLGASGIVGYDQVGTGEVVQKGGALYYGLGGSFVAGGGTGGLALDVAYLWRSVPEDALVMDPLYPENELRLGGKLFFEGDRITGLTAEYRAAGDIKTILLGLRLRL